MDQHYSAAFKVLWYFKWILQVMFLYFYLSKIFTLKYSYFYLIKRSE